MGGGTGEVQKKDSRKGKFNFKKFLHAINPKKYSCKGLKKNHTRNLIKKKIPAARGLYPVPGVQTVGMAQKNVSRKLELSNFF